MTRPLSQDTITGNLHCMALAVHALLAMVENHDPRMRPSPDGEAPTIRPSHSHRRFMEVTSLVLLHLRQSLESGSRTVDVQVEPSCCPTRTPAPMPLPNPHASAPSRWSDPWRRW